MVTRVLSLSCIYALLFITHRCQSLSVREYTRVNVWYAVSSSVFIPLQTSALILSV